MIGKNVYLAQNLHQRSESGIKRRRENDKVGLEIEHGLESESGRARVAEPRLLITCAHHRHRLRSPIMNRVGTI